ncbi:Receptor-like serine/threonine-protein kinase [Zea mays]|uniref:Receptor-like serine/threonine-protein kinase n=1 Tax=Zea mays TaxID=4577 RepID=A0A3L6G393_MAIZE|nr:Receptor-like serine/threonine-protein kinase [Zea mays]
MSRSSRRPVGMQEDDIAPPQRATGHLTSKGDVYSFRVVLLEMLTGRRSMDKKRPTGEQNLVAWARPYLNDRRRLYQLVDPRLGLNYSVKGVQKVAQICHYCLTRDTDPPKAEEAIRWFYPSASAGNARAQYNLGLCLQNGKGVKRNQKEASELQKNLRT